MSSARSRYPGTCGSLCGGSDMDLAHQPGDDAVIVWTFPDGQALKLRQRNGDVLLSCEIPPAKETRLRVCLRCRVSGFAAVGARCGICGYLMAAVSGERKP
jgi:hypothetical protein